VVAIAESHVGGITVSKGWAFVSGQGSSIRKYRLTELRDALKAAGTPYLGQVGTARDLAGSSFIGSVVKRGQKDLDAAALSCFRAPSMTEGITEYNGIAYLVYESGSYLYASDPATLNVIPRMHKATISSLTSLVP
jgi:hypothetical protein